MQDKTDKKRLKAMRQSAAKLVKLGEHLNRGTTELTTHLSKYIDEFSPSFSMRRAKGQSVATHALVTALRHLLQDLEQAVSASVADEEMRQRTDKKKKH
jgi:hypothetical protein